jgi:hypothetical protein
MVGDFIFVNDVRIRLDLSTYAAFSLLSRRSTGTASAPIHLTRDWTGRNGRRS